MIALLALRPMRLRNLSGLELGRTPHRGLAGWCITIPADETKTHRKIGVEWPPDLVDAHSTYRVRHRPVLLHGSAAKALWIGSSGQALAEHTIRQAIIRRTQATLGVPINPICSAAVPPPLSPSKIRHMSGRPRRF
jgi:hypothetical protein